MAKAKHSPQEIYLNLLGEIKQRDLEVAFLLSDPPGLSRAVALECVCLQFRKMLELVAFSTLAANERAYVAAYKDFSEHWNAELMLRDVQRINPGFYPVPVRQAPPAVPGTKASIEPLKEGFLTKEEFVAAYKKCGRILHAASPYKSPPSHHFYEKAIKDWREKLGALLSIHYVRLIGEPGFWMFHMKEEQDDHVHAYTFVPVN